MKIQTSFVLICILFTICYAAPWNLENLDLGEEMNEENGNDFEKNRRMMSEDSDTDSEGSISELEKRNLNAAMIQQAIANAVAQMTAAQQQQIQQQIEQQIAQNAIQSAANLAKAVNDIAGAFEFK